MASVEQLRRERQRRQQEAVPEGRVELGPIRADGEEVTGGTPRRVESVAPGERDLRPSGGGTSSGEADKSQRVSRARSLLQERRSQRQSSPDVGVRQTGGGRLDTDMSFGRGMLGLGETAASFATGAVAEPVAGLSGILRGMVSGDLDEAAGTVERVREALTFAPRTEEGQRLSSAIAGPFQALSEGAGRAGEATLDVTGSPAAATGVSTALEALPMAIGARRPVATRRQRQEDIARLEEGFERTGVNPSADRATQVEQASRAAERETPIARGEGLTQVQRAATEARERARQERNRLYEEARATNAGVRAGDAQSLPTDIRESLASFDVQDMPVVRRRLNELDELRQLPEDATVKLRALEDWRRRINQNRPARANEAENAALNIVRGRLDSFIDSQFNADMIRGDASAVSKWRDARRANMDYRERFTDNKTIRQLTEQQATPEEIRNWLFGASAAGAKKEAGAVTRRLKDILGEDSPEFTALRQEALLDIMDPLLQPEPNLNQFVRNHDRLVRRNQTLVDELMPESATALRDLRDQVRTIRDRPEGGDFTGNMRLDRAIAVALGGHELARGALRVGIIASTIPLLRRAAGKSQKRQIMANMLGYDPMKSPLTDLRVPATGGVAGTAREREEGEQRAPMFPPDPIQLREAGPEQDSQQRPQMEQEQ